MFKDLGVLPQIPEEMINPYSRLFGVKRFVGLPDIFEDNSADHSRRSVAVVARMRLPENVARKAAKALWSHEVASKLEGDEFGWRRTCEEKGVTRKSVLEKARRELPRGYYIYFEEMARSTGLLEEGSGRRLGVMPYAAVASLVDRAETDTWFHSRVAENALAGLIDPNEVNQRVLGFSLTTLERHIFHLTSYRLPPEITWACQGLLIAAVRQVYGGWNKVCESKPYLVPDTLKAQLRNADILIKKYDNKRI